MILGVSILDLEGVIKFVLSMLQDPGPKILTRRIIKRFYEFTAILNLNKPCSATAETNTDDENLVKVSVVDCD